MSPTCRTSGWKYLKLRCLGSPQGPTNHRATIEKMHNRFLDGFLDDAQHELDRRRDDVRSRLVNSCEVVCRPCRYRHIVKSDASYLSGPVDPILAAPFPPPHSTLSTASH